VGSLRWRRWAALERQTKSVWKQSQSRRQRLRSWVTLAGETPNRAAAALPEWPRAKKSASLLTTVESLGQRLREALAQVLGQAIGEAIQDAIGHVLLGAAPAPARYADPYYAPEYYRDQHEYGREEEYEQRWEESRYAEPRPEPEDSVPEESLSRWHTAILAGLQAMALWLGERPGRRALLTALGVGAATGLLAYLAGPVFGAGAAVLSTVVSLLALADGTRLGIARLLHTVRAN
jgi:hypothetical protein